MLIFIIWKTLYRKILHISLYFGCVGADAIRNEIPNFREFFLFVCLLPHFVLWMQPPEPVYFLAFHVAVTATLGSCAITYIVKPRGSILIWNVWTYKKQTWNMNNNKKLHTLGNKSVCPFCNVKIKSNPKNERIKSQLCLSCKPSL